MKLARIRGLTQAGHHGEALAEIAALPDSFGQMRDVLYLTALNQRCLGRNTDALETLHRLEARHPGFSRLHEERGHCYLSLHQTARALTAFERAVSINPALLDSWSALEPLYRNIRATTKASRAAVQVARLGSLPEQIVRAGSLFSDGELPAAQSILRAYIQVSGNHVEALRMLGRIAHLRGALDEAEPLFQEALSLSPDYRSARADYVRLLLDQQKYHQARDIISTLLGLEPENRDYLALDATACAGLGEHERAIDSFLAILATPPSWPHLYILLGRSLQALGRQSEAIESYRAAAQARPGFGDAYWSLANLKTYRFAAAEIGRMRLEEAAPAVSVVDRYHLCFALGKALEDQGEHASSWRYYERGNALKSGQSAYDPRLMETVIRTLKRVCTPDLLGTHRNTELSDATPIFIVGMPRSGSTLLEQILASHSQIEGTQELPVMGRIAHSLQGYPGVLADLGPEDFRRLGEQYLKDTRPYRNGKPFFIDKMPNNFRHIGLIHLALPHARIIDVRREPMACCFSNLKQLFARGQEFSYTIEGVAHYYRSYLELMRHWNRALPGRVLRVYYEDIVEDLETVVRRTLQLCGLELEPACIEFHKTARNINTASSEQVRQPIFRTGIGQWRHYEPWLGPLREALGDALSRYRE